MSNVGFQLPRILLVGVGIASAIVVFAGKAPGAAAGPRATIPMIHAQHPNAAAGYSGSVSGAILGAQNNATSPAFGVFGVEGFVPYTVGGVGLLGYAQAAKSYGVYGVTFGTNGTGVYGTADSATPTPDDTPDSANESIGVAGNSGAGAGVYGSTQFQGFSDYLSNPMAGVMGVDAVATSGPINNGVVGMTTNGAFGVDGRGGENALGGVLGFGNVGVYGVTESGVGGLFDATTGVGVAGSSESAYGNVAGGKFTGNYIALLAQTTTPDTSETYPFDIRDAANNTVFDVDNVGNTFVNGTLFLHNGQSTYVRTRSAGVHATTYAATTSNPTLEDVGEGELVGGQAFVKLDPSFAQAIDSTTPYHVFVTPEGETRGVFVSQKSMTGFTVRENANGRSTTSFSYRIIGSQFGESGRRIALQSDSTIAMPLKGQRLAPTRAQTEIRKFLSNPRRVAAARHFVPRPLVFSHSR